MQLQIRTPPSISIPSDSNFQTHKHTYEHIDKLNVIMTKDGQLTKNRFFAFVANRLAESELTRSLNEHNEHKMESVLMEKWLHSERK